MGLLSKVKPKFLPEDLNSDMIKQIFNECVATESTVHRYPVRLYESDHKPSVTFDLDMIHKETKTIRYLLGQCKAVHDNKITVNLSDLSRKYDGTSIIDEDDKVTPIQLVALGIASISTSELSDHAYITFLKRKKTLSPFDPAFPAWWAEHKAEWEE